MSSKQKKTRKSRTQTPQEPESEWIKFITDESNRGAVPFIHDESGNAVMPKGNPFQVDLPSLSNEEIRDDSDSNKWLGTRIWPRTDLQENSYCSINGGDSESNNEVIVQETHKVCSCPIPGSVDCVQHHVTLERRKLQSELGSVYQTWKFDEMGGEVADTWTLKDIRKFICVMKKRNSADDDDDFLDLAMRLLPGKSRASIVNYYFNVYVPWRIDRKIRLGFTYFEIDTDDEGEEEIPPSSNNSRERAGDSTVKGTSSATSVQSKYLRASVKKF